MSELCPWCLKPLPEAFDLPVCPHCGERLPEQRRSATEASGPPATGAETREELTRRFFAQPDVYTISTPLYVLYLLAPFLLPLPVPFMGGPNWLLTTLTIFATILSVQSAIVRWPGRHRVILDPRGIRRRGRAVPWSRVTGSELSAPKGRRLEPERLDILVAGEPPIPIARELIRTGQIQSLRNLAAVIDLIVAAPTEDSR